MSASSTAMKLESDRKDSLQKLLKMRLSVSSDSDPAHEVSSLQHQVLLLDFYPLFFE